MKKNRQEYEKGGKKRGYNQVQREKEE